MRNKKQNFFTIRKDYINGFTLIELMMTIAVIALIASVVAFSLVNARIKARNARRAQDISLLQKALEIYKTKNATNYPNGGAVGVAGSISTIDQLGTFLVPDSITIMPHDPSLPGGVDYQYSWTDDGRAYALLMRTSNELNSIDCAYRSPGAQSLFPPNPNPIPDCNFEKI